MTIVILNTKHTNGWSYYSLLITHYSLLITYSTDKPTGINQDNYNIFSPGADNAAKLVSENQY